MNISQAAGIVYGPRAACVGCKGPTEYVDQVLHAGMCAKCRTFILQKVKEQLGANKIDDTQGEVT